MNETPSPSEPGQKPPKLPSSALALPSVPSKKFCAFLGFLLFVGSVVLSFAIPFIFLFGLAGAIASLFFPGYRFIFVGYILTVGVLLLGTIIYCSNHPLDIK